MKPLLFMLDAGDALQAALLAQLPAECAAFEWRRFPDGETYLRIDSDCRGRDAIILCTLHRPDPLALPVLFVADTLRELGARAVGLAAPYLAYMRQDIRFAPGEAVTSRLFARLLSAHLDWLVTVDPHLHRYHSLDEIYTIPTLALSASPLMADWIRSHVERPLLIGPDSESVQWVAAVAEQVGAPFVVLEKIRRGDREVEVSVPEVERWRDHTPVLVDDIISTGHTLLETIGQLRRAGLRPPVCVAVHGLFAETAAARLAATGARVVTTNSVAHTSNGIDLAGLLAPALRTMVSHTALI